MVHMHEEDKEDTVRSSNYKLIEAKLAKAKDDLRIELDRERDVKRMADEFIFGESGHK